MDPAEDGLSPEQRIDQAIGIWQRWLSTAIALLAIDAVWDVALGLHRNPWESWLLLVASVALARGAEQRGWLAGYRDGRATT